MLELIKNLRDKVRPDAGTPWSDSELRAWISKLIAEIDHLVGSQLAAIINDPKFQRLEASWRGVRVLTEESSSYRNIKIRLLDISWERLAKDLDRANDFDQSFLFQRVYSDEFGMPGGEPFGILLGDYYVSHKPSAAQRTDDVAALKQIAQVAAAAFCPFICSASPALFGLDSFQEINSTIDFGKIFNSQEYIRWRSLRDMEEARFLGIALPDVVLRQPYDKQELAQKGLFFESKDKGASLSSHLWGNAAIALGAVIVREFGNHSWFSTIKGVIPERLDGGLVTAFPSVSQAVLNDNFSNHCVPVVITDRAERELAELGFMTLCHCYGSPYAAFFSNTSLKSVGFINQKESRANARVSAMLQQILCASRIAHYIKAIVRDKIGTFQSGKDCERVISEWLRKYTTGRSDLSLELRAKYPLRDFRVEIREVLQKPGVYACLIHLKPHYIADNLSTDIRLTTELVPANNAA